MLVTIFVSDFKSTWHRLLKVESLWKDKYIFSLNHLIDASKILEK